MFAKLRAIRPDRRGGHHYLMILGVVPTRFTRKCREHPEYILQVAEACREDSVRLFAPVARHQSCVYLSMHAQGYRPVADALQLALNQHRGGVEIDHA